MKKSSKKLIYTFWIFVGFFAIIKYIYQVIYEKTYISNILTLFLGIILLFLGAINFRKNI
ncbi:hypothetical protein HMPREF3188_01124 [Tissierellia bacterium KA00581]|nr:hypothetical protein HMPREF3188_01124 [Tissierellia bacterium KA00581]